MFDNDNFVYSSPTYPHEYPGLRAICACFHWLRASVILSKVKAYNSEGQVAQTGCPPVFGRGASSL